MSFRWTPHPVIVTIMDNKDYVRVFLSSYYTTITGWGVLICPHHLGGCQNYGPFLGPCYNTAPNIQGTQKGTMILTITYLNLQRVFMLILGTVYLDGSVGLTVVSIRNNSSQLSQSLAHLLNAPNSPRRPLSPKP